MRPINQILEDARIIFIWVVISGVIMILDSVGWMNSIRSMLERSLATTDKFAYSIVTLVQTPHKAYTSWQSASQRIASLEERLSLLATDHVELERLRQENQELQEVLELVPAKRARAMNASLIPTAKGIRINKGSRDGLTEGLVVIAPSGSLIGHIDKVGTYTSLLKSLTDAGSTVSVRVVGRTTGGIAVGDGFRVQMNEVLQTEALEPGDVVITTGAEGTYPEGVVLGQITQLVGDPSDVTKAGIIDTFAENSTSALILLPN